MSKSLALTALPQLSQVTECFIINFDIVSNFQIGDIHICIEVDIPCTTLVQKVELEIDDTFNANEDFAKVF